MGFGSIGEVQNVLGLRYDGQEDGCSHEVGLEPRAGARRFGGYTRQGSSDPVCASSGVPSSAATLPRRPGV